MSQTPQQTIKFREVRLSPEVVQAREAAEQQRRSITVTQLAKQIRAERIKRQLRRAS